MSHTPGGNAAPRPTRRLPRAPAWTFVVALAACGGDDPRELPEPVRPPLTGVAEQPVAGGTAVLAELSDMEKPMPIVYQTVFDGDLVDVMYMGLTRGAWRNGRMEFLLSDESPMAMAWHWEPAGADSAALRFRMRSALRWSDGKPITARDVVWSYTTMADARVASPRQEDLADLDSVKAENDSTVVFHFRRRTPNMLFAASFPIAPEHQYASAGAAGLRTHPALADPTKMVVSGPFRVGSRRAGEQITLVPNPTFAPKPRLDAIAIRIIPESTTRIVELQTGKVDFVRPVSTDAIAELRRRAPNLRFEREHRRYWEFVAYNPRVEAFRDARVRRALGMAVNVPEILRGLRLAPFAAPAAGPYPPIFRELHDPARMKPLPFDTTGARALLAAAGWRDTDGDGVVDRDGKRLSFTLLTNTGNQRRADVSQIIQQQWKRIGVEAELRQLEFNTLSERQMKHDFDAVLGSWGVNLNPDITVVFAPDAPFNIVSFNDTAAARLMKSAKEQPTAALANPLWRAAAERIVQEQPYTWLYYYDPVTGVSDRLRGVRVDTFGAYQNVWEWWIPRARQGRAAPAVGDTAAVAAAQ
ncbi:MAG TPA: ABC transporter substrate-binding protein [Longimicrobium sp.]|nr:ABC transporter substrate-binding protein [Longimicrobium sp.]